MKTQKINLDCIQSKIKNNLISKYYISNKSRAKTTFKSITTDHKNLPTGEFLNKILTELKQGNPNDIDIEIN